MPLLEESFESANIERNPLPTSTEIRAAQQSLSTEFRAALGAAKTSADKAALSRRWMSDAENPDAETAIRYATLQAAMNVAASAGEATLVVQCANMLGDFFEVDRFDLKANALRKTASAAQTPEQQQAVAAAFLDLADEAKARGDKATETGLLDLAASAASKSQDAGLSQRVEQRLAEQ